MLRSVELAATFMLAGLIWTVQLVHYPALAFADPKRWAALHALHTRRISWIVVPLMLAEATSATAVWLTAVPAEVIPRRAGMVLLGIAWVSTFALQVPIHERLAGAFDARLVRRLIATNWIRTAAWSGRAVLLLWSSMRA